ncbi:hypothetical protein HWV62_9211 [Athelia sp. TMB]|nr:hypothetical protein HWV62_9211 [Athelia sp. TMB]
MSDISSIDKGLGLHVFTSFANNGAESAPIKFMIDTGSTGFVVGSALLQPSQYQPTSETFQLVYTSSGNKYDGIWVVTTVSFYSSENGSAVGAAVARTVPMKVRLAEKFTHGGTGKVNHHPRTVMLGVGFDRDTSPGALDPGKNPIPCGINPFLMLEEMRTAQTMVPGFILTPSYIKLGITAKDRDAFEIVQLERQAPAASLSSPSTPRWAAPNVNLSVPTANIGPMFTEFLMDTGLGYSIVQAPLGIEPPLSTVIGTIGKSRVQVADGQEVVISIPGIERPLYRYTVGTSGAPEYVLWKHNLHDGMPFVNTSMYGMGGFDYLYDDENGNLGFRFLGPE